MFQNASSAHRKQRSQFGINQHVSPIYNTNPEIYQETDQDSRRWSGSWFGRTGQGLILSLRISLLGLKYLSLAVLQRRWTNLKMKRMGWEIPRTLLDSPLGSSCVWWQSREKRRKEQGSWWFAFCEENWSWLLMLKSNNGSFLVSDQLSCVCSTFLSWSLPTIAAQHKQASLFRWFTEKLCFGARSALTKLSLGVGGKLVVTFKQLWVFSKSVPSLEKLVTTLPKIFTCSPHADVICLRTRAFLFQFERACGPCWRCSIPTRTRSASHCPCQMVRT